MKLTDISGVGESKARVLRDAGYETAADLRRATQNELADVEDVGAALAARIKADVGDLSDGEAESATAAEGDAGDEAATAAEDDAETERDPVSVDPAWRFRYGDTISGAIASDGETVYIGGKNSVFYAVDAATGQRRWEFRTGGELWSRPVVAGGTVYVEVDKLYALDAVSGEERWRAPAGNPPAVAGDTVYVTDSDGTLYARDARTGEERWRTDLGWVEQPVVADRTVYVSGGSELIALETESGRERWRFEAADRVYTPTVDGWSVYVGSADNSLYGLAAESGRVRWRFETGGEVYSSPTVADGTVYVGSDDGNLYALDTVSGTDRWRFSTGREVTATPVAFEGTVAIASEDLFAVDAETGTERWRVELDGLVDKFNSPRVADGTIYVAGDAESRLHAVDADTGAERRRLETADTVYGSPIVTDETVCVDTFDGTVCAIPREPDATGAGTE